ncbi:glycosyltransferase [Pontibacter cellulosilyticus]|uniref:Glycosyltransferase n=1 Tax=Pontibacter cellulosilyticus TaxID=1720253 RepID=A0A923SIS4_9BACT|nr:glycosyltransferase [Pontibacter cellulosilyticus]MBC5993053.1 glycosyltransferase [Pontibacter cellulosilyticus]
MKLRIAYSISFFPALSETYLLNQLAPLFEEGHDVTIFSTGQPENWTRHAVIEKYNMLSKTVYRPHIPKSKVRRLAKALKLLLANYRHAKHLLQTLNFIKYGRYALNLDFFYDTVPFLGHKQFDVVHCHFGPNAIKALNLRELGLLQGELITSFHGYDVNHREFLSRQSHASRKGLYKDLAKECRLFTVNSHYTKQKAINLGIPEANIAYLPVGLNTKKFSPDNNRGSKHHIPTILTVARLTEFKGLKYSIVSVSQLLPTYPDIRYHILGEGEQRQELEQLIKELKLTQHVFLHGAATQEQVLEHYNNVDVFVLAGIKAVNGEIEAQGLVVQEAQSMALPLVVTDAGGIPEGMLPGKSGFVVEQKNAAAIADKIDFLLKHPETCRQMGKAGRAYVQQNFDNHVLHQKLMTLYYSLLKDRPRKSR